MRALVFGAPGSGARTQAAVLAERFAVPHLDRSALLAEEPCWPPRRTGRAGTFVRPAVSDVAAARLLTRLQSAVDPGGWILSGFPRTVQHAVLLADVAEGRAQDVEVAIRLDVPRPELTARLLRRGTSTRTRTAGTAGALDDRMEVGPLSGFYEGSGRLLTVDGSGSEGQVASDLLRGLHSWLLERRLSGQASRAMWR